MMGYSGGSLASGWAASLQPSYAPELNIQGVALGGLVPNISSVLETITGGLFAGLAFAGLNGFYKAYPNFTQWLDDNMVPSLKSQFFEYADECLPGAILGGAFQNLYSYFVDGAASLQEPVPSTLMAFAGEMGTFGVPQVPLYIYKAIGDEVSPVRDTDELVAQWCQDGVSITYYRDTIGEHISEAISGSTNAILWILGVLEGQPAAKGCSTTDIALTAINPDIIPVAGLQVYTLLEALLVSALEAY